MQRVKNVFIDWLLSLIVKNGNASCTGGNSPHQIAATGASKSSTTFFEPLDYQTSTPKKVKVPASLLRRLSWQAIVDWATILASFSSSSALS
ncbi:hypothetical protein B9Z55_022680 [Caenorhabditis nigoni]|uniref:Uncharacterized protein n=1 Tax=Caenorhabditis nigoni TaxID=1611254 RepID=A0A2G5SLU9_9PELO|nr:hypothetical protein B9Z55_022680 [Caenorhabditis nigoni]